MGVEEKGKARREIVDVHAALEARIDVGHAVGERERQLLRRRRPRLADVVAGDRDGVPLRHLARAVLDRVDDEAHRRRRRKDELLLGDELLEDVVLQRAAQRRERHALLLGHREIHAEQDRRGRVDGHRSGDLAQRNAVEQGLHVRQRVDGDAAVADLAAARGRVGVLAHQRRHVERDGETGLAVGEQVLVAPVGLLRGREARELAHRPQPPAVSGRVDAARVRELPWHLLRAGRQVFRRVERLDRDARDRRRLDAVVAPVRAGLEVLLPGLLRVSWSDLHGS